MESAAEPRLIDLLLEFGNVGRLDKATKAALRLCNKHLKNSIDATVISAQISADEAEALLRSGWNLRKLNILKSSSQLSQVSLTASLPAIIDRWPRLEDLMYLEQGAFIEALPETLGNLMHLRYLRIELAVPALPSSFGQLSSLAWLEIGESGRLALEGLEPLKQLRALKYLQMDGDIVSKPGFLEWILGNLSTSLEDIDFYPGVVTLPSTISNFGQLTRLRLGENRIEEVPESIGALSMLKTLDLSTSYQVEREGQALPLSFTNLTTLEELDISPEMGCVGVLRHFTGLTKLILAIWDQEIPDLIWNFNKLKDLHVASNNPLSSSLSESLGELQSLKRLHVENFPLLEILPDSIEDLSCLEHLAITGPSALIELPESMASLPSLARLCIRHCNRLETLPDLCDFPYNAPVTTLILESCHGMTELPIMLGHLFRLKRLDIHDRRRLTELPESIAEHMTTLKCLGVTGCDEFTTIDDEFVPVLLDLQWLSFYGCKKLKFSPEVEEAVELLKSRGIYKDRSRYKIDDDDDDEIHYGTD